MDASQVLLAVSAGCVMLAAGGKCVRAWLRLPKNRTMQVAGQDAVNSLASLEHGYALGLLFFALLQLFFVWVEPHLWRQSGLLKLASLLILVLYATVNDGLQVTKSRILMQAAMVFMLTAMVATLA